MKWMALAFRCFLYGWAGLSALLLMGIFASSAFMVQFSIENKTSETLLVTPIGTVGKEGRRRLLPVSMVEFIKFPAKQASRLKVASGEIVAVSYDMDDINFSEIVVETERGEARQLVTNPTPTQNQYHGPAQQAYAIDDWNKLEPLSDAIKMIPLEPHPYKLACRLLAFIVPPWILLGLLAVGSRRVVRLQQREDPSP